MKNNRPFSWMPLCFSLVAVAGVATTGFSSSQGHAADATAANMAGIWVLNETVENSDCTGTNIGDRSAILMILSQSSLGALEGKALGTTSFPAYAGVMSQPGTFELVSGIETAKSTIKGTITGTTLTGTRTVSSSTPCSAVRKIVGNKL